jgi:hypothetical protein
LHDRTSSKGETEKVKDSEGEETDSPVRKKIKVPSRIPGTSEEETSESSTGGTERSPISKKSSKKERIRKPNRKRENLVSSEDELSMW